MDLGNHDLNTPRPGIDTRDFAFQQPRQLERINSWSTDFSIGSELRIPSPSSAQQRAKQESKDFSRRIASHPENQFKLQVMQERDRIWNTDSVMRQLAESGRPITSVLDLERRAREKIKERWVDQGIWWDRESWDSLAAGYYMPAGLKWKHEQPGSHNFKSVVEAWKYARSDTDTETNRGESRPIDMNNVVFDNWRPKSNTEKEEAAKFRAAQREKDASRPFYQFVYQISTERSYILKASANLATENVHDIHTRAYENVSDTWKKWGIWDDRWGMMPGMSWKHERLQRTEWNKDQTPSPVRVPSPDHSDTVTEEPSHLQKEQEVDRAKTGRGLPSKKGAVREEEQSSQAEDLSPNSDGVTNKSKAATKKRLKASSSRDAKGKGKRGARDKLDPQSKAKVKSKSSSQRTRRRPSDAEGAVASPPRRSERIKRQEALRQAQSNDEATPVKQKTKKRVTSKTKRIQ